MNLPALAFLTVALALPAFTQDFDSSGNGLLQGDYFFRETTCTPMGITPSRLGRAVLSGTITFNGNGSYTVSESLSATSPGSISRSGTYTISASGYGFLTHPYYSDLKLRVLVTKDKLLIGSPESWATSDLFIAVPVRPVSNATLKGAYSIVYNNPSGGHDRSKGTFDSSYNTVGILNADGAGNIGSISFKTNALPKPSVDVATGVTYNFSNNVGTLRVPTGGSPAMSGDYVMYVSPDGNFIFGGTWDSVATSPLVARIQNGLGNPIDMFVGVRRGSTDAPKMNGLYYQVWGFLGAVIGSFSATDGVILEHTYSVSDSTARLFYPNAPATSYTDGPLADYIVGQNADIRIGTRGGLSLAIRAPDLDSFTPPNSAPYIHPMGVTNAASFAPFTASVAPGELVNIYGANFGSETSIVPGGIPFPTTLGGVQVFMNERLAPLYFVTPGQLAVIVPYATIEPTVRIRVELNGVRSNEVTSFVSKVSLGVFALGRNGIGPGAVTHANAPNYTLVSPSAPAHVGEVVQVFMTGLGPVSPKVPDGGIGGAGPLNYMSPTENLQTLVDGEYAEVTFAGLAPFLAGLYQVNVKIPPGVRSGDVSLAFNTNFEYYYDPLLWGATSQVTIHVAAIQ
jgi:uncharacterized protein (TIGR03437 family)